MALWVCTKCGYVYNEETGDMEHGITDNTQFEKLPDTWVCPRCGVPKSFFKKR